MEASDSLVRKIISKSRIVSDAKRRELAAELSSHVEDLIDEVRAAGHDDTSVQRIVCQRFGHPEEIGRAFAETYRTERIAAYTGFFSLLAIVSLAAVGSVISTLQLLVAIYSGAPPSVAFHGMRWEIVGFLALTWGYVGMYFAELLFRRCRLVSAVAINAFLFLPLVLVLRHFTLVHVAAPVVAFVCGGMVRILQRLNMRFLWCAGTAIPLLLAWLSVGPVVDGDGYLASWEVGVVVWMGMTLSCAAMTSLTKLFDRRVFASLYVDSSNSS
jgi:hypothetical protein